MTDACFKVDEIAGEICWQQHGQVAFISWIAVESKGQGHGTTLLRAFEEYARGLGLQTLECINQICWDEPGDDILRRFQFFQKNGFDFVALERLDLPSPGPLIHFKRAKQLEVHAREVSTS